jgi:hypothetical protein
MIIGVEWAYIGVDETFLLASLSLLLFKAEP